MLSVNVENVEKRYGFQQVFREMSFRHESGVLGIAGSNGSGKSTLIKCLAGLIRPSEGTVEWQRDGHAVERKKWRRHISLSAPYVHLYEELTLAENLGFFFNLKKRPDDSADKAIAVVGLESSRDTLFGELSSGQQQRARLALMLESGADAYLLDEPGTNLDRKGMALVGSLVEHWKADGKLIIIASNNPEELALSDTQIQIETWK